MWALDQAIREYERGVFPVTSHIIDGVAIAQLRRSGRLREASSNRTLPGPQSCIPHEDQVKHAKRDACQDLAYFLVNESVVRVTEKNPEDASVLVVSLEVLVPEEGTHD